MDSIIYTTKPDFSKLPGGVELTEPLPVEGGFGYSYIEPILAGAHVFKNFLSGASCDAIVERLSKYDSAPVSIQGMQEITPDTIGSVRTTCWSPDTADILWKLFSAQTEDEEQSTYMYDITQTDWWQSEKLEENHAESIKHRNWIPVGVSPMLRYMKYETGGQHFAHYDAAFIYPGGEYRTLKSFVLYLTTNKSGATRFINDRQALPVWERDHSDWTRPAYPGEVIKIIQPEKGNMLVFDHRMCHDVEPYDGAEGDRIIIRGDIIYKKV
jgi:hypothetical protein